MSTPMTDDALNRRAAELMGWFNIERITGPGGMLWGNEPGDEPGTMYMPIPAPTTDYEDALKLQEYTLQPRAVSRGETLEDTGKIQIRVYRDTTYIVEWLIWRGVGSYEEAETLPLAITRACVAALEAVRAQGEKEATT